MQKLIPTLVVAILAAHAAGAVTGLNLPDQSENARARSELMPPKKNVPVQNESEKVAGGRVTCNSDWVRFVGNVHGLYGMDLPFVNTGEGAGTAIYRSPTDYLYYHYDNSMMGVNSGWYVGPEPDGNGAHAFNHVVGDCPEDLPKGWRLYYNDTWNYEPGLYLASF